MLPLFSILACSTPTPPPAPAPAAPTPAPEASEAPVERAAPARVPNDRPPTIDTITLTPEAPRAADTLTVAVKAVDPENTPLDVDVTWFVNDAEVLGVTAETLAGRFVKGDRVRVRVNVEDQSNEVEQDGPAVTIGNTPPVFETGPKDLVKIDGFAFRATDPDGDRLTWRLEGAPSGMSISPTGVLAYTGSATEPGGKYVVAVIVEDGQAFGRYEFPLNVTAGSKAAKQ